MGETEPGPHTIKTHGAKVAKKHKHDWLILLLLVVIDVVLNVIHPFYRFVGKDMMTDLKYPLKDNTVPIWAVPVSFSFYVCALCTHVFYQLDFPVTDFLESLITRVCTFQVHFV